MTKLYPRLREDLALAMAADVRGKEVPELEEFVRTSHPGQQFAPVGGTPVEVGDLDSLREALLVVSCDHGFPAKRPRATAPLDRELAGALHAGLDISPHSASDHDMWSFLTLCLLPDVAVWRYPSAKDERLLGHVNRNVFRRLWWRVEILGEPPTGPDPVWDREDVLVQIMERPGISGNPIVARLIVDCFRSAVSGHHPAAYQRLMRDFQARILRHTAFTSLDLLDERELASLFDELMGETIDAVVVQATDPADASTQVSGLQDGGAPNAEGRIADATSLVDLPLDLVPEAIRGRIADLEHVEDKRLIGALEAAGIAVPKALHKVVKSFAWYMAGKGVLSRDETSRAWSLNSSPQVLPPVCTASIAELSERIASDPAEGADRIIAELEADAGRVPKPYKRAVAAAQRMAEGK